MAEARPLAGRRIAITRAPEQADELENRLREMGAEVLRMPMVRFLDPQDTSDLDRAIGSLDEFAWVVFTSANAVRFFLKRCRALRSWPAAPEKGPRIAGVGSATRAAVEAEGLRVALEPAEFNASALAAALGPQAAGDKVLLPRSDAAGSDLPGALRAAGAKVAEVIAYRTAEAEMDPAARTALLGGQVDAVTFFSPSAFHHFARALGADALRELGGRTAFAAVGPMTAAAIRQAGLGAATVQGQEATSASLAAALAEYLTQPVAQRVTQRAAHQAGGAGERARKGTDHVSR